MIRRSLALACGLCALGCGGPSLPAEGPRLPVVPLSFEVNLLTATKCLFLGGVTAAEQGESRGATLVVVYVGTHYQNTTDGVTKEGYVLSAGKAVRCPAGVQDQVLAVARREAARGQTGGAP